MNDKVSFCQGHFRVKRAFLQGHPRAGGQAWAPPQVKPKLGNYPGPNGGHFSSGRPSLLTLPVTNRRVRCMGKV